MDFGGRILLLLVFSTVVASGLREVEVTCLNERACALRESSVTLVCSYSDIHVAAAFWFRVKDKGKWRKEAEPEDLVLDSDYAGRANTKLTNLSAIIEITDLRDRDSGEYRVMLVKDDGERLMGAAGIDLTVTDLQVTRDSRSQVLFCRTSCRLTYDVAGFYWYGNGQFLNTPNGVTGTFLLSGDNEVSYSCSVYGHNKILASPLCAGSSCWSVTYPEKRVCVLKGSAVEFSGSYLQPSGKTVSRVFWHSHKDLQDLRQERRLANRVWQYSSCSQGSNCTLKINQLAMADSGEYRLRVVTTDGVKFSGKPGVVLTVTDLQVRLSRYPAAPEAGTAVTLSCATSCTLPDSPAYVWYRNGRPLRNTINNTKHNKLYLSSSKDSGNYYCAVEGREDRHSPEQTVTVPDVDHGSGYGVTVREILIITIMGVIVLALIIAGVALYKRRKKPKSAQSRIRTEGLTPQSGQVGVSAQDDVHYSSINFRYSTRGSAPTAADNEGHEQVQYAVVNIRKPAAAT